MASFFELARRAGSICEVVEVELAPDIVQVLDALAAASRHASRDQMAARALREWATERGYIPTRMKSTIAADKLSAWNDG